MKKYYIYKIVNSVNEKVYVGQTSNPKNRFYKVHYHGKFRKAIDEIGWEKFTPMLLETTFSKSKADELEEKYMNEYDSIKNGYNTRRKYHETGNTRSAESNALRRATMQKMRWWHNPKTGESMRILNGNPVPNGFLPGRGMLQRIAGHDFSNNPI